MHHWMPHPNRLKSLRYKKLKKWQMVERGDELHDNDLVSKQRVAKNEVSGMNVYEDNRGLILVFSNWQFARLLNT